MLRDVYSGRLKLFGEEHMQIPSSSQQLRERSLALKRFEEAKSLLRKMMAVARRVLGENHEDYAQDEVESEHRRGSTAATPDATLGDLREAVTTLEDTDTDRAARARWRAPLTRAG